MDWWVKIKTEILLMVFSKAIMFEEIANYSIVLASSEDLGAMSPKTFNLKFIDEICLDHRPAVNSSSLKTEIIGLHVRRSSF